MLSYVFGHIASYPRLRYVKDGHDLDLSFITPSIAAMSLPAKRPIEQLYRNHLSKVRTFLDSTSRDWRIFEFRGEGAGYDDVEDFDGKVSHFPFVDHHPPPFELLPRLVADMHKHLTQARAQGDGGLCVLHCKAGKGRSGLAACSYLVSHGNMTAGEARALFTKQRMRKGFGEGLSIPSQVRYLSYVERWAQTRTSSATTGEVDDDTTGVYDPDYTVAVTHVDVENLSFDSKLALRRFTDGGRGIEVVCELDDRNCTITRLPRGGGTLARQSTISTAGNDSRASTSSSSTSILQAKPTATSAPEVSKSMTGAVTRYTLKQPQRMPADVGLYLSRGSGWMHCWFNAFWEDTPLTAASPIAGKSPPSTPQPATGGRFEIDWDNVDGWKGTTFVRGKRCFDRVAVHWTAALST